MVNNALIFLGALLLVVKGATLATKYSAKLAESYRLSKYTVGFIIVAIISILPETFISVSSALKGIPSFGLGMLFGSNIADLTLVMAIVIFAAGRGLKVESKILKSNAIYSFLLLLPLVFGFDGYYSRIEGLALIITGAVFYIVALKNGTSGASVVQHGHNRFKYVGMLILSMVMLLVGSHFVVVSAVTLAGLLGVTPILVGMLVVGLGTTMPELFFSLRSARQHEDSLAIGDILGTVLADATIVVGVLALISPFSFPQNIVFVTGAFMVAASFLLFHFMRSRLTISKKEAVILLIFWVIFVLVEFVADR